MGWKRPFACCFGTIAPRHAPRRLDRAQRRNSFRLSELGLRPEREKRGAASHTAKGLRALWNPCKGAALNRVTDIDDITDI